MGRTYFSVGAGLRRHSDINAKSVRMTDLFHRFRPQPPTSAKALLIRMGPFIPEVDAFRFKNSFPITEQNAKQIRDRFRPAIDVAVGAGIQSVRSMLDTLSVSIPVTGTVSLPGVVIDAVIGEVSNRLAGSLIDKIIAAIPGTFGRCGGMAFSGYDFYLANWRVDDRLGTTPPATGELGDYIFRRLLDSLDLNVEKFVDWVMTLHVMPVISKVANVTLGAAVGSLGGPIGSAFGVLLGNEVNVFDIGGPAPILERTRSEWEKIKNKLDSEAAWPIGLIYGDSVNPIDQHQILAVGYSNNADGTAKLIVWDNNDANKSGTMKLDFGGKELLITAVPDLPSPACLKHAIKGIFLEDYKPSQPPPELNLK